LAAGRGSVPPLPAPGEAALAPAETEALAPIPADPPPGDAPETDLLIAPESPSEPPAFLGLIARLPLGPTLPAFGDE